MLVRDCISVVHSIIGMVSIVVPGVIVVLCAVVGEGSIVCVGHWILYVIIVTLDFPFDIDAANFCSPFCIGHGHCLSRAPGCFATGLIVESIGTLVSLSIIAC